jgi:hypothetical protein
MFIAETYPFSRKLPGKRKFSAKTFAKTFATTKFRENLLIFASFSLFAKMEKTVFVSTLLGASQRMVQSPHLGTILGPGSGPS